MSDEERDKDVSMYDQSNSTCNASDGESIDSSSDYFPECLHGEESTHFTCEFCECTCEECELNLFDTTKCEHTPDMICDYCEAKYVEDMEYDEEVNHGYFINDGTDL